MTRGKRAPDVAESPTPEVIREVHLLSGHQYKVALTAAAITRLGETDAGKDFFAGNAPFGEGDDIVTLMKRMVPFIHATIQVANGSRRPTEDELAEQIDLADVPELMTVVGEVFRVSFAGLRKRNGSDPLVRGS